MNKYDEALQFLVDNEFIPYDPAHTFTDAVNLLKEALTKAKLFDEMVQAKDREIAELKEHIGNLIGIPAKYGFCEPVEGYVERPQDIAIAVNAMGKEIDTHKKAASSYEYAFESVRAENRELKSRITNLEKQLEGKIHDC